MDQLFSQEVFRDFGPLSLAPETPPPPLTRAAGGSVSQLRKQVAQLSPRRPGVYGMLDAQGLLHYIGKAKNLRTRLLSYFRPKTRPAKATRIIRATRVIVWEAWSREFSALLRELELIRRWRPRWNVAGQPLPLRHGFLCLGRAPAPYLFLTRQAPRTALATFGPVPMGSKTETAVRLLNDTFKLRDCPQAVELSFPEQGELFPNPRPVGCLRFDLGTCLAPCTGTCPQRSYFAHVRKAKAHLETGVGDALESLRVQMRAAAESEQFERAAILRDKLEVLDWFQGRLERLRRVRADLSLVYPVQGPAGLLWWYLIEAGRPLLAVTTPSSAAERQNTLTLLERIYRRGDHPALVDSFEHLDGMLLVSSWFRRNPAERRRCLTPEQAMSKCRL